MDPNGVLGSLRALHPTHASFDETKPSTTQYVRYQWRSRDNRKGRHTLIVPYDHPQRPSRLHTTLAGVKRMLTQFPYWDVSYWVAVNFVIGSAIFVASGLFYWLPIAFPSTKFQLESSVGGGVTSFVGATFFQIGAVLLCFEAVNENQTGCFGWAVEDLFYRADPAHCEHPHQSQSQSTSARQGQGQDQDQGGEGGGAEKPKNTTKRRRRSPAQTSRKWRWWPSWKEVRTYYIYEIGFLANFSLATGATIFYVCGILSLPGLYGMLSQGVIWGVYYLTYLVGGLLFVFSSALYMLETQEHWYKPAPRVLGWHIGLWNMIGSVGWTYAASLGYCEQHWCEYQSELTLIWASAAFLVGSVLLWFEALDKWTIERGPKNPKGGRRASA